MHITVIQCHFACSVNRWSSPTDPLLREMQSMYVLVPSASGFKPGNYCFLSYSMNFCGQDRLVAEQQRCEKLQAELAEANASHQKAAAEGAGKLAEAQQALAHLEEDANQKMEQADAAIAEAEGQLEEVTNELQDARDAVKVSL